MPYSYHVYTFSELRKEIEILRRTFDVVRVVSPEECLSYHIGEKELTPDIPCYSLWNRKSCCDYCLSRQVLYSRGYGSKLESLNGHIFIVMARYIQLGNRKLSLEMATELPETAVLGNEKHALVEIQRLQEENSRLMRDPLTNCYSRHYMDIHFHHYALQAKSNQQELCIAVLDMDNFKDINDKYGHAIGDEVLKSCCHFWLKYFDLRHHSFLTRYGGDEFIITAIADSYEEFCEHITILSNSMRKNIVLSDGSLIPFSFTIGCACMSELEKDHIPFSEEALFALADSRLYLGKHSGRNRIVTGLS